MAEGPSALKPERQQPQVCFWSTHLLPGLLPCLFSCLSTSERFKQTTGNRWREGVCLWHSSLANTRHLFWGWVIHFWKALCGNFTLDHMTNHNSWQWHKNKLLATMTVEQRNVNAKWRHSESHKTVSSLSKVHYAVEKCMALFCDDESSGRVSATFYINIKNTKGSVGIGSYNLVPSLKSHYHSHTDSKHDFHSSLHLEISA